MLQNDARVVMWYDIICSILTNGFSLIHLVHLPSYLIASQCPSVKVEIPCLTVIDGNTYRALSI